MIIAAEVTHVPEFPMYRSLLAILGQKILVLADPGGAVPIPSLSARRTTAAALCGAGGLRRLARALNPRSDRDAARPPPPQRRRDRWKTVVIGASTGGIEALLQLLAAYSEDCPPTLIVQHIRGDFLSGLARRLDRNCAAKVGQATGGALIQAGQVWLAPGNSEHLALAPGAGRCRLVPDAPVSGHRPAVDVLFRSAVQLGPEVVAVLLTGMGSDGADGMAEIRAAGGWTIAQDEASSTVYGMPRSAVELGAVAQQLPIDRIGGAVLQAARRERATSS